MKKFFFNSLFTILINFFFLNMVGANTALDFYIKYFYSKSEEASQILKEIETNLKEGSRKKVCSRQREAAKLGLLANESLIKAFEISGEEIPSDLLKASKKRWQSIFKEC